jgi:hypothetical protein
MEKFCFQLFIVALRFGRERKKKSCPERFFIVAFFVLLGGGLRGEERENISSDTSCYTIYFYS